MKPLKGYFTNIPLLILVLANMAPIYGVVVFGWDAFYIFDFLFIIFNFSVRQGTCRFAVVNPPQASSLCLSS